MFKPRAPQSAALIFIALLVGVALLFWFCSRPSQREAVLTQSSVATRDHQLKNPQPGQVSENQSDTQNRIEIEERRLRQLRDQLEAVRLTQNTETAALNQIAQAEARIAEIESLIAEIDAESERVEEATQSYRRENDISTQQALINLETRIQMLNNNILDFQNARFLEQQSSASSSGAGSLPANPSIDLQISQIRILRAQLRSQARAIEMESQTNRLVASQTSMQDQSALKAEKDDLYRQLSEAKSTRDYWRRQKLELGNPAAKEERIQALETQVTNQEQLLSELRKAE